MIYEHRVYLIKMGTYQKLLEELRTCFTAFEKHGYDWLGPFRTEIGVNPQISYFNIWRSLGDRETIWKAISDDPELAPHFTRWHEIEANEGPIISTITNTINESVPSFPKPKNPKYLEEEDKSSIWADRMSVNREE